MGLPVIFQGARVLQPVVPPSAAMLYAKQPVVAAPFIAAQPPARSAMLVDAGQPVVYPDLAFIRWPQPEQS